MNGNIDLRNDGAQPSEPETIGEIKELTEGEKAQIKMTYWVLGGIAIIFLISGASYITTDNGVADFLADLQGICSAGDFDNKTITAFCEKYLVLAKSEANSAAKEVFEFCKNFLPPIVTLVLGAHYVTKSSEQNT